MIFLHEPGISKGKNRENGGEIAYVEEISLWENCQKEYTDGLLWEDQRVYYCMYTSMTEIICSLLCSG